MLDLIQNNKDKLMEIIETISSLRPDLMYFNLSKDSKIPIAVVCLQDAWVCLLQIQYAFTQIENNTSPFIKYFYFEDIASRIYTASEHLAYSIQYMHDIDIEILNKYRTGRSSHQITIGKFIKSEMPSCNLLEDLNTLASDENWLKTIEFRKDIIHEQPPIVKDVINKFKRSTPWKNDGDSWSLQISLNKIGDEPEYTLENINDFISNAFVLLIKTNLAIVRYYKNILKDIGISLQ